MNENLLYAMVKRCHINSTAFYLNTTNEEVELLKRKMKRTLLGIVISGSILFFILSFFFITEVGLAIIITSSVLIFSTAYYSFHFKKALRLKKEGIGITNRNLLQANWVTQDKQYESLDEFCYLLSKSHLLVKSRKKNIYILTEIEMKLRDTGRRQRLKTEKYLAIFGAVFVFFLGAIWNAIIEKTVEGTTLMDLLAFTLVLILFCLFFYNYFCFILFEEVNRCDVICNRLNDLKIKLMQKQKKTKKKRENKKNR